MGMRMIFRSSCSTNVAASAPDPSRWALIRKKQFKHGYAIHVKYFDCTNFEGNKIMVYRGQYKLRTVMDPHFADSDDAPIARFKPDREGWLAAQRFASGLRFTSASANKGTP